MILCCQQCQTRFDLADALATPGTAVQCSRCGQLWTLAATVIFNCRHCRLSQPFQRSAPGADDWACTRCGTLLQPGGAVRRPPAEPPARAPVNTGRVMIFGAPAGQVNAPAPNPRSQMMVFGEPRANAMMFGSPAHTGPPPPEPVIAPCETCGELRLERGPAPLGLVFHGCGRCAHTVLDKVHVAAQRAQVRSKGYRPGSRCPICETRALVEEPQTGERPRQYRCTACDAAFPFGALPVPDQPGPRTRPARWANCSDCSSTVWRLGQAPRSVPSSTCDRCGRRKFDDVALGHRRAWARQMTAPQRLVFGLGPSPYDFCIVCGHQRVIEGRCAACGEVYDGKPLGPSPDERSEATLLERIAAAPDDDAPRRVLADVLLDRGDERGEFITLQLDAEAGPLTAAAQQRLDNLLVQMRHRAAPPGVEHTGVTFRRGFPDAVVWPGWTDPQHPGWRTVTELLVPAFAPDAGRRDLTPLGGPPLTSLRQLRGAGRTIAGFLVENPPPNLTTLGLWLEPPVGDGDLSLLQRLLDALPRLNDLSVHERGPQRFGARRWGPTVARLVAARLFRLRLHLDELTPGQARELVARDAPHLTLQLEPEPSIRARAWVEVDDEGTRLVLREQVEAPLLERVALALRASGLTGVDALDLASGQRSRWEL
ncbi:MAG: zinc-ribbon domain-containing protein [Myxococcaceae bacterium]|nr:zinc-ribbon domain-containing protein [Myxococcaceae bacterium]